MNEHTDARIVGEFNFRYRFYSRVGKQLTETILFENDDEAISWAKTNLAIEYARGIEMRRYED